MNASRYFLACSPNNTQVYRHQRYGALARRSFLDTSIFDTPGFRLAFRQPAVKLLEVIEQDSKRVDLRYIEWLDNAVKYAESALFTRMYLRCNS